MNGWSLKLRGSGVALSLDTETKDGQAVFIAVAHRSGIGRYLSFPRSFGHAVEWLAEWGEKYVAFNMDYDARALLAFLPKDALTVLFRDEVTTWDGWKIYYRKKKEFTVKGHGVSLAIYDIWAHFQMSLDQASEEVLGEPGKDDVPEVWHKKWDRIFRSPRLRPRGVAYSMRDARTAGRLWEVIDVQCRNLGVPEKYLVRPLSPGSIAAGYFGDRVRTPLPPEANWIARRAYAGGRIEVFKRGYFPRVYVYDIKSAYPHVLSRLPDPRNSRVVRDRSIRPDALYSVYRVRLSIPSDHLIPPFPLWDPEAKSDLRIYPAGHFVTWLTGPEVDLALKEDFVEEILDGLHLCGVSRPWLSDISDLYKMRKSQPHLSQAIKLILNSTYGKIAQTDDRMGEATWITDQTRSIGGQFVGRSQHLANTSNFFVASYVTALTRLRLHAGARELGLSNVIAFMTDGIISTRAFRSRTLGSNLGDWSVKIHGGSALVVGSGVYSLYDPVKGVFLHTTRGHRKRGMTPLPALLRTSKTVIPIWSHSPVSLGEFVTKRNSDSLNAMVSTRKTLDVNFDKKRHWPIPWTSARQVLRKQQDSKSRIILDPRLQ